LADPALGQKQICPNCQTKFYDLAKRPAHCPKCDFEFDPEEALKNRRARPRTVIRDDEPDDTADKPVRDEDTEAFEEEDAEATPEIDEAAEEPDGAPADDEDAEAGAAAPGEPEPDLGVDFDEEADAAEETDDVPFLEDEDADIEGDDIALPGEDEEER
jgi:uncharacterized protein (TIGR02300 family)